MDSGGHDVRSLLQSFHDGRNNLYLQVYSSNNPFPLRLFYCHIITITIHLSIVINRDMNEGDRLMDILTREHNVFISQSAAVADLVKKVGVC